MYSLVFDILTLLGSIALFLFGMKLMSESLLKIAGNKIKNFFLPTNTNRFKAVSSGFFISGIIQSSTAVTVMIVSFVNAGMINLTESVAYIFGANVGTTITQWFIYLLGFKINILYYIFPLLGIGFPFLFTKSSKSKNFAEFMVGFSIIFIAFDFLKHSIPDATDLQTLGFLTQLSSFEYFSVFIFFAIGLLIAALMQSSSVVVALITVVCTKGLINFEIASAMVIGSNVGSAVTTIVASKQTNTTAKRAAFSHLLFNFLGAIFVLAIFHWFVAFVEQVTTIIDGNSPFEMLASVPLALAVLHTFFNLFTLILLVGFIPLLTKLIALIFPQDEQVEEEFRLKFIHKGILSTSELSTIAARNEINVYAKRISKMFLMVKNLFNETNETKFHEIFLKIRRYEEISDSMETEISDYLTRITENEVSNAVSVRIRIMLKIVASLENSADIIYNLSKSIERKRNQKIWFTQEMRDNINSLFLLLDEAFKVLNANLSNEYILVNIKTAEEIEIKINKERNRLKKENIENIENQTYKFQAGFIYTDLFTKCERLGDCINDISKIIYENKNNIQ